MKKEQTAKTRKTQRKSDGIPVFVLYKEQSELRKKFIELLQRDEKEFRIISEEEYVPDKIFLAAKAAVAEELDRKRKLGLPIVVGGGDRVLIMIGDKIIKEIPYRERTNEPETPAMQATSARK